MDRRETKSWPYSAVVVISIVPWKHAKSLHTYVHNRAVPYRDPNNDSFKVGKNFLVVALSSIGKVGQGFWQDIANELYQNDVFPAWASSWNMERLLPSALITHNSSLLVNPSSLQTERKNVGHHFEMFHLEHPAKLENSWIFFATALIIKSKEFNQVPPKFPTKVRKDPFLQLDIFDKTSFMSKWWILLLLFLVFSGIAPIMAGGSRSDRTDLREEMRCFPMGDRIHWYECSPREHTTKEVIGLKFPTWKNWVHFCSFFKKIDPTNRWRMAVMFIQGHFLWLRTWNLLCHLPCSGWKMW